MARSRQKKILLARCGFYPSLPPSKASTSNKAWGDTVRWLRMRQIWSLLYPAEMRVSPSTCRVLTIDWHESGLYRCLWYARGLCLCPCVITQRCLLPSQQEAEYSFSGFTPVVGPLSKTHFSKSEFKNGHISRFCFVLQVIQVISWGKFSSAEEVDLSFGSWIWIHESDFKGVFLEERPWKSFSIQCSNSGINYGYQVKQNLKSLSWIHFYKCDSGKVVRKLMLLPVLFKQTNKQTNKQTCDHSQGVYLAPNTGGIV